MIAEIMQQNLAQRFLANLQIVGAVVLGIVVQWVDVAWGESGRELVQMPIEIVELALGIWIAAFVALELVSADENFRLDYSIPCVVVDALRSSRLASLLLRSS